MKPSLILCRTDVARLESLLERVASCQHEAQALGEELARAEVLDILPSHVIGMNSCARFVDEHSGQEQEVTLVLPHQLDGQPGKVSVLAPVGCALLGLSVGQRIEWPMPGARNAVLRVTAVRTGVAAIHDT